MTPARRRVVHWRAPGTLKRNAGADATRFLQLSRRLLPVALAVLLAALVWGVVIRQPGLPGALAADPRVTQARGELRLSGAERLPAGARPSIGASSVATTPVPAGPPVHMAYFSKAGCPVCARVNDYLAEVQGLYPQLIISEFPIEEEESKVLSEWLGQRYGMPEEQRLTTPAVFVGEDFLVGRDDVVVENLRAIVERYVTDGAEPTWEDFDPAQPERSIIERFLSFGALTVIGAGLVDGLNPCAFATIVFFISYLAFLGRRGREILAVGAAFALGVFITYFLVGVGLLKVLEELPALASLSRWVYGLTALLCLVLAVVSFLDYRKARRGEATEMMLRIPLRLRQVINRVIREGTQVRAFIPVAFATGFVISLVELACTGQVYLPTIIFVVGMPDMRGQALFYLVLYNLAFILPLVAVFGLAYFGTTSEQLGIFAGRHTATVKLGTAVLFIVLAGWLVSRLL